MKNKQFGGIFRRNTPTAICSDILSATLPFITIGLMNDKPVLYISVIVGSMALIGLILCVLFKSHIPSDKPVPVLPQDFSLPYAIALSTTILKHNDIDFPLGFWVSLFLSILVISNIFTTRVRKKL